MSSPGLFFQFHFYLFGLLAVGGALLFVTRKSPVAAALWLVNVMFCISALFVMLDAPFIGAIQVLVYAGAIMVVFLFVVMLLNLGHPSEIADLRSTGTRVTAGLVGLVMLAEVLVLMRVRFPALIPAAPATDNVTTAIAAPLFREYLLPFELTSVLLLAAIVGAVVLAKRRA
ncbi:MAG TPA: NADH-quinone oxidoreductase subunit J [Gemmatimonadaceae bacterium]|jgi:NADH-quinone oxidoreductase subunit J|nr:NADH-quinone oxidoreductase subunit J [Gemmatimonadaceae bacterium]